MRIDRYPIGYPPAGARDVEDLILLRFELLKGAAQLVGAGGAFAAAVYAVQALYHVVYLLAGYEAAYSLQVAVAASQECYLLDDVVVIGHYVYQ